MDLSIIIVNYNTTDHLDKCLDSLYKFIKTVSFEVIVVDNDSSDRTIEAFTSRYSEAKFYFRKVNDGFGAGCNFGVSKSEGKKLLFINPDIEFIDSSFLKLLEFLEANPDAGACSGLLLDENNSPAYNFNSFPDYSWEFKNAFGIGVDSTISELLSHKNITTSDKSPFEVDWFHGAFLLVDRNVFLTVGGFDEKIFLYYEDVDLQKKIKETGKKIFCLPDVSVKHFTQSSVRSKEGRKTYYYNMHLYKLYYMQKNFGMLKRSVIRVAYILGYLNRIVLLPFRRKFKGRISEKLEHYGLILKLYLTKYRF